MSTNDDIQVLLVDDEEDSLSLLESLLKKIGGIQVVGTAQDVDRAFTLVKKFKPDLLFLDIEMPRQDGFELLRMLSNEGLFCDVIFVTAHDEYAIKAIKHAAFDYLLKPIDVEELVQAVRRYKSKSKEHLLSDKIDLLIKSLSPDNQIKINTRSGFLLILFQDILFLEADGNYTNIHLTDGNTEVSSRNLGNLEGHLPEDIFKRLGRSVIINISHLYKVDRRKRTCTLQFSKESREIKLSAKMLKDLKVLSLPG